MHLVSQGKGGMSSWTHFLTSLSLANKLIANKTNLLWTMSKMRQELSPSVKACWENYSQHQWWQLAKSAITLYTYKPRLSAFSALFILMWNISTETLRDFRPKICRRTVCYPSYLPDLAATGDHSYIRNAHLLPEIQHGADGKVHKCHGSVCRGCLDKH